MNVLEKHKIVSEGRVMTESTPSNCFVIAVYNETKFILTLEERTIKELLSKAVSEPT